ncbi:MAG TPA: GAF domain-containing protein, partial [Candidatus Dormibacteraeota bacterium]|nr:GAF domain-containing protein [Candidatus Dormibacteraeota bacterium]
MIRPPVESNSGLAAVLRGIVADFQHASGAEIVSVFLYEESTNKYYAPFATGQPQESLLDSLTDMHEQLTRYLTDEQQGKVPDELGIHHYGSTVWLTATRQRLVARNAPAEIDSTFIRRYQIQSTIGLPLIAGDRLLGLVYLNYRNREKAPDDNRLRELERKAGTAAGLVQNALEMAERSALEGLSRLTSLLTIPVGDARTDAKELRRLLSIALADLLMASNLDGAAIYQFGHQRSHLELVTAHLRVAAPMRVDRSDSSVGWEAAINKTVGAATEEADLHPVATYALGKPDDPHGYLVVLSRDHLATVRRAPSTDEMLKAGAQLIGGALASQRLIAELENSNRLLSALGDMTTAMLRPGASRHDVIDAVVGHLTDSDVPEFDFNFATVYLLDEREDGATVVKMAAGAVTAEQKSSRWATTEEDRVLAAEDVLVYVARAWQPV